MLNLYTNEKGFTLVELILTLSLVAMVMAGFIAVYWFGVKAFAMENNDSIMQHESRVVREAVENDSCAAEDIKVFDSRRGAEIIDGSTAGGCLKVIKCEVDGTNTSYTEVYYYVSNEQVYRERWDLNTYLNNGDDVQIDKIAIARNITSVEFVKPVSGSIEYTINAGIDEDTFSLHGRCRSRVDYGMSNLEG